MSDFEKVFEMLYEILNMPSTLIYADTKNKIIHVDIDCFGKFNLKVKDIYLFDGED